jgi:hypothetical protein
MCNNAVVHVYRRSVQACSVDIVSTVIAGKHCLRFNHLPVFIKIWVVINSPAVTNLSRDSLLYWLGQGGRPDGGAVTARTPAHHCTSFDAGVEDLLNRSRLRSALFRGFTQRRMLVSYRSFGTTYWSHLQGSGGRTCTKGIGNTYWKLLAEYCKTIISKTWL